MRSQSSPEKIHNRIQRIRKADRENTTLDERVRRSIELDLVEIIKDEEPDDRDEEGIRAALSDLDARKLDRVLDLIKELWPTHCVRAEMADVERTVFPPQSNKPWDEPTSGNHPLASSEHISTEAQPNNPGQQREPAEPEMLVPTRGPNGIRWVPFAKR